MSNESEDPRKQLPFRWPQSRIKRIQDAARIVNVKPEDLLWECADEALETVVKRHLMKPPTEGGDPT